MIFRLEVEVGHIEGKFVSRDEIESRLVEEVEQVALDSLGADGVSEYEIQSVDVIG